VTAATDLAPRQRRLIGRLARLASACDWQVSVEDRQLLDVLVRARLVQPSHKTGARPKA
jgi:hypothetical protein